MHNKSGQRHCSNRGRDTESAYCYLYYVAFAAFCFWRSLSYINVNQILFFEAQDLDEIAKVVMLLCLSLKLILQKYNLRAAVVIGVCLLILLLSCQTSYSKQLIWLFLFVCASQGVKVKTLALICFVFYAGAFVVGVAGWFLGEIEAIEAIRFGDEGVRSSLGFRHPNSFGYIATTVCFSLLVLRFPKPRVFDVIFIMVVALTVNVVAGSRTSFLAICIGVVVAVVYSYCCKTEHARRLFAMSGAIALMVLTVASVLLMVFYDPGNELCSQINKLLSSRLSYANHYFRHYSLSLFGSNVPQNLLANTLDAGNGFVVDNAFCNLCLRYGIVPAFLLVGGWIGVFFKAFCTDYRGRCILALSLWIVVAFAESTVLIFSSNFGLVAISALLYGSPLASLDEGVRKKRADFMGAA